MIFFFFFLGRLPPFLRMIITIKSKNAFGIICSCKEMHQYLKENQIFWKAFFASHFGRISVEVVREHHKKKNKNKKLDWKQISKNRFEIMQKKKYSSTYILFSSNNFPGKLKENSQKYLYFKYDFWLLLDYGIEYDFLVVKLENIETKEKIKR